MNGVDVVERVGETVSSWLSYVSYVSELSQLSQSTRWRPWPSVGKPEWADIATGQPFSWDPHGSHARAVDKLETTLIKAGFDAPDAAVERGDIFFENLQEAAGVVFAAPFGQGTRDAVVFHHISFRFFSRFQAVTRALSRRSCIPMYVSTITIVHPPF